MMPYMRATVAIVASAFVAIAGQAQAETLTGRASVIDADTLEIHGERIRILDIDAPETRQACIRPDGSEWRCGQQGSLALADWIGARPVTCETTKRDRYKRWLARCSVGGSDVAEWLASQGWVFAYRDTDTAASLMKPANEDVLVSRPVSEATGNVKDNGPEFIGIARTMKPPDGNLESIRVHAEPLSLSLLSVRQLQ